MPPIQETQPIHFQLTVMKLPESRPQAVGQASNMAALVGQQRKKGAQEGGAKPAELVLYPGEASELLVQLSNLSSQDLELELAVTGTFPQHWCRLGSEGTRLPRGSTTEAVLYFQLEPDFFESPVGRQAGDPLTLDYQGSFEVRSRSGAAHPQVQQTVEFQLFVRPRSLYLNFLPDVYREVDFVGRFLKIFEQTFESNVQMLTNLWAYLSPQTAPEAMLPFLAHWVGWSLTPQLSLQRQRQLIAKAVHLYRWRGTRRGLGYAIHLFTGLPWEQTEPDTPPHIEIQEFGGRGFMLGETRLGRDTTIGGGRPYHFIVQVRPLPDEPLNLPLITQVIEQEKPAFCTYELKLVS
ncbi:MAG: phage tail protein [Cyanobacteria bacterium P01_G01_bin.54]